MPYDDHAPPLPGTAEAEAASCARWRMADRYACPWVVPFGTVFMALYCFWDAATSANVSGCPWIAHVAPIRTSPSGQAAAARAGGKTETGALEPRAVASTTANSGTRNLLIGANLH